MQKFTNSVKYSLHELMINEHVFTTPGSGTHTYKVKRLNEFGDWVLMYYNKVEKCWENVGEGSMPRKARLRISRWVCGLIMTIDIKLTTITVLPNPETNN